jgi:hypothetical protein
MPAVVGKQHRPGGIGNDQFHGGGTDIHAGFVCRRIFCCCQNQIYFRLQMYMKYLELGIKTGGGCVSADSNTECNRMFRIAGTFANGAFPD